MLPAVAKMAICVVAGVADRSALNVTVADPPAVAGMKETVTPDGRPDAVSWMGVLKFPLGITITLEVALLPWGTETFEVEVESEKSPGPAIGEGSTSYRGRAGVAAGFSSANEIAKIRTLLLLSSLRVVTPGAISNGYANKYE
jgi:hypothetical protein